MPAIDTLTLVDMLAVCDKTGTRPVLEAPWVAGDDVCATNSYALVIHPGIGKDCGPGQIPKSAIELASKMRAPTIDVTPDAVIIATPSGPISWPRPTDMHSPFPDVHGIVKGYTFDDDRAMGFSADILSGAAKALGIGKVDPVRMRRAKPTAGKRPEVCPVLVTRGNPSDASPYGLVMPIRLADQP